MALMAPPARRMRRQVCDENTPGGIARSFSAQDVERGFPGPVRNRIKARAVPVASASSSCCCKAISASVVPSTLAGSNLPAGRVPGSSRSILTLVVLKVRDLLPVGLAGRIDANGGSSRRVDDDVRAPVDNL